MLLFFIYISITLTLSPVFLYPQIGRISEKGNRQEVEERQKSQAPPHCVSQWRWPASHTVLIRPYPENSKTRKELSYQVCDAVISRNRRSESSFWKIFQIHSLLLRFHNFWDRVPKRSWASGGSVVNNPPPSAGDRFSPWVWGDPLEKEMATTPVFLPGESMEKRTWRATVHGVTKELKTWLSN